MDDRKIYSEQEAADLIVAAAKLQESDGEDSRYSAGVSWSELQKMAGDVGVDPEYLRKALAVQSGAPIKKQGKPREFLGMPLSEEFERVVDAELPPDNFDVIAGEFYNPGYGGSGGAYGGYGGPSIIGRMMKGQFYEGLFYGTLEVSSRHGRTRIKARSSNAVATWAIWFPIVFLAMFIGIAITTKKAPEIAPLYWLFWGLGSAGLWAGLGLAMKASRVRIVEKLDRVVAAIEEEASLLRDHLASSNPVADSEQEELRENLRGD